MRAFSERIFFTRKILSQIVFETDMLCEEKGMKVRIKWYQFDVSQSAFLLSFKKLPHRCQTQAEAHEWRSASFSPSQNAYGRQISLLFIFLCALVLSTIANGTCFGARARARLVENSTYEKV